MDERQFDRVARQLAAGMARREVLRALVGSIVGGTLSFLGRREAGAEPKYRDPWISLGDTGCNKNKLCYPYQGVICYHGRCCMPGPVSGFGCNGELDGPNPNCCSQVCVHGTNECQPV
jgi:hypothetical protein